MILVCDVTLQANVTKDSSNFMGDSCSKYLKYPNLVRTQVEIISDPNYLVRILFERKFSKHLI